MRKVTDFAARMKMYELAEAGCKFMPRIPIIARIDGRCFSAFTHGLARPYDERMSRLMTMTTRWLVSEANACIGYTQSDEITLIFHSDDIESQVFFDGRISKMVSVLASMATAIFNHNLSDYIPEKSTKLPVFDCRVWNVPTKEEAVNCLIWREQDAVKNSISMAAQAYYSHKQLMNKNSGEKQEMLFQKGINWNNYPAFFKRGTYIQRKKILRKFTEQEIEKLPPKHNARLDPNLVIERTEIAPIDMPPLTQVENRVDVVFNGATPIPKKQPH